MKPTKSIVRATIALLTGALAFGISAPAFAASTTDATINIGSLYEPQNLDNTGGGGQGVTEALNGNVYESLFKLNDSGKLTNLLAKSYKISADGLTYTITLRSGVKFHSGKALTSDDVKFSLSKVTAADSLSACARSAAILGSNRIMPSSMPRPARRIGTTSGFGLAMATPSASATGVRTVTGSTRM